MRQQRFFDPKVNKQSFKAHLSPKAHTHIKSAQKTNQSLQSIQNILVSNQNLQHQLAIYGWRNKTQFPIVKISQVTVKQRKGKATLLQIRKQKSCLKLKNCKQLPLFKALYLLKQSIIGFQRLFNKFGPFKLTSSMVAVNGYHKCKVWLNQNYASNEFIALKIDQPTFLSGIYHLFLQKSNNLKNTIQFYHQINSCKTFSSALALIENFTKQNRIVISSSCKLTTKEMSFETTQTNLHFSSSLSINPRLNSLPYSGLRISLNTITRYSFQKTKTQKKNVQQDNEKDYFSVLTNNGNTEDTTGKGSKINKNSNCQNSQQTENLMFNKREKKEIIYKSQLAFNARRQQKPKLFIRKFNSHKISSQEFYKRQSETEFSFNIPKKQKKISKIGNEKQSQCYLNDDQDEEITKQKIDNTFAKNQWNKRLNGLWQRENELTNSIVNNQQKVKPAAVPINLQLLGKISKNAYQSFINSDNKACPEPQPQANKY